MKVGVSDVGDSEEGGEELRAYALSSRFDCCDILLGVFLQTAIFTICIKGVSVSNDQTRGMEVLKIKLCAKMRRSIAASHVQPR